MEYKIIFELMKFNMYQMQLDIGLEWDPDGLERNYKNKENYSIYRNDHLVGFISLEVQEFGIFIHTLQVERKYQNRFVGYQAFVFVCNRARCMGLSLLRCSIFENNIAYTMYTALGFREVSREKGVLKLELDLSLCSFTKSNHITRLST